MFDNLPLIVIFIAAGSVAGYAVYTYFKRRKEYFYELNNFVGMFLSSVMYSKDSVVKIIEDFDTKSKLLTKHLSEYMLSKKDKQPLELSAGYLKKNETAYVKSLLNMLGTSDAGTQNSSINARRAELIKYMETADERFSKNGSSSIKLGVLCGLLLSVIFL